jgi:hypothetical protein
MPTEDIAELILSPEVMAYRVMTDYFVCGVFVLGDMVVHAAPIMSWAVGKPWVEVATWIAHKGGYYSACV